MSNWTPLRTGNKSLRWPDSAAAFRPWYQRHSKKFFLQTHICYSVHNRRWNVVLYCLFFAADAHKIFIFHFCVGQMDKKNWHVRRGKQCHGRHTHPLQSFIIGVHGLHHDKNIYILSVTVLCVSISKCPTAFSLLGVFSFKQKCVFYLIEWFSSIVVSDSLLK